MVAKEYQDELKSIKEDIRNAYQYDKPNYDRYHKCRNFIYNTNLNEDDIEALQVLQKPAIETNILASIQARLVGNFAKQQPSYMVTQADGVEKPVPSQIIDIVQGHLDYALSEANNDNFELEIYEDILSGGMSAIKLWTEYESPKSFKQKIKFSRVFDPTLCGGDPMARLVSKWDGRYVFENFPTRKKEFEREYDVDISKLRYAKDIEGFNWAYSNGKEDILIQSHYYRKKTKKKKLIYLTNGETVYSDMLDAYMEDWKKNRIEQLPRIKDERKTDVTVIVRYHLIGTEILEVKEMDFPEFPLIFLARRQIIRPGTNSAAQAMSIPYMYHAIDAQRLMNFAGQTLANDLENMVQHKFKAALEGIPVQDEYGEAYSNIQKANLLVYNQFKDDNPDMRIDPPQEIQRVPAPPEVMGTFSTMPQIIQTIVGSNDAALALHDNNLSGEAIVQGATMSDATADPYVFAFLQGMNSLAQLYVNLMPKYLVDPMSLPVITKEGKRTHVPINGNGGPKLNYDTDALKVKVKPALSSAIQRARSLQVMGYLSKTFPIFGQLMQTEGLSVILDNVEFNGSDKLKEALPKFMQQQQMMQQQAAQMDPRLMKTKVDMMKLQMEAQQNQMENQFRAKEQQQTDIDLNNDTIRIMMEANQAHDDRAVQMAKANAEVQAHHDDLEIEAHKHALDLHDQLHRHHHDGIKLEHEMSKSEMHSA
jgi:hypothetical protein